jgi:hypothetical protein
MVSLLFHSFSAIFSWVPRYNYLLTCIKGGHWSLAELKRVLDFKFIISEIEMCDTYLGIITVGLLTTGKIKTVKNVAEFPKTPNIIPVLNSPVTNLSILKLQKLQKITKI